MARGLMKDVDMAEKEPTKEVLWTFHALSWVFVLGAVAAAIAWFVFVGLARHRQILARPGETSVSGIDGTNTIEQQKQQNNNEATYETITVCFQALVASVLLYFVFRHHFDHK